MLLKVLFFFMGTAILTEDDRRLLRNYWSNVTNDYRGSTPATAAVKSSNEHRSRTSLMLRSATKCCNPDSTCSTRGLRYSTLICDWWRGTPLSALARISTRNGLCRRAIREFHSPQCPERGEYGPGDIEQQVAERVAAAANFAPHITERQRPNGSVLLLRGEPLNDKGFVTLYSDVTEQRYIENLTEHQNIQLDERVRRRTAQLENANANLTRANSENGRIAAALRRSEERLRLINDTIPILIGYVDRNEIYQYANKGYSDWSTVTRKARSPATPFPRSSAMQVYAQIRDPDTQSAVRPTGHLRVPDGTRNGQTLFARSTLVPEITAGRRHAVSSFFPTRSPSRSGCRPPSFRRRKWRPSAS
jgi:PAS domain-containing protein